MSTAQARPDLVELFSATCEAAGVPRGRGRLAVYFALPVRMQERIEGELVQEQVEPPEAQHEQEPAP